MSTIDRQPDSTQDAAHLAASRRNKTMARAKRFFGAFGLHLVLISLSFILILPFCWMVLTSLKDLNQVGVGSWIPSDPTAYKNTDLLEPEALLEHLKTSDAPAIAHMRQINDVQIGDVRLVYDADGNLLEETLGPITGFLNDAIGDDRLNNAEAFAAVPPGEKTVAQREVVERLRAELNRLEATPEEGLTEDERIRRTIDIGQAQNELNRAAGLLHRYLIDDTLGDRVRASHALQWENYFQVFAKIPFARYYWNSLFVAAWVTFLQVFTSSLAAFSFARLKWPGRDKVFLIYLSTMMLPGLVMMIPNYQIMITLGLVDTLLGLILPGAFSAFGTFLLRQFMLGIPASLDEAAEIDGASKWRLYWDVILPLARPGLITLAIFTFIGTYHGFFWPLVMLKSEHKYTLPIGLLYFDSTAGQETNLLMAAVAMSVVPMVIVFVFLQKQLVAGIQLGAVKG